MLIITKSLKELDFSALMAVYADENRKNGLEGWPEETEFRQQMLAEQEFYEYLRQVFFRTEGAACLIWQEGGVYVSALRLEPYRDGLLLEALETAPEHRRRGYGKALICEALEKYKGVKIYSHVDKKNLPSQRIHEACGFCRILDYAVYADGSVLRSSMTYCHE